MLTSSILAGVISFSLNNNNISVRTENVGIPCTFPRSPQGLHTRKPVSEHIIRNLLGLHLDSAQTSLGLGMLYWQDILPIEFLGNSERNPSIPLGTLGFHSDSDRIRWGSVKSSLLLSCDESSEGGFELGLSASDVLSPSSSGKRLVFFFFFGLRSSLAFRLIFLMVELAFDARDLKDCVLDLIEALLHFDMV
jgi:hypothetical protein